MYIYYHESQQELSVSSLSLGSHWATSGRASPCLAVGGSMPSFSLVVRVAKRCTGLRVNRPSSEYFENTRSIVQCSSTTRGLAMCATLRSGGLRTRCASLCTWRQCDTCFRCLGGKLTKGEPIISGEGRSPPLPEVMLRGRRPLTSPSLSLSLSPSLCVLFFCPPPPHASRLPSSIQQPEVVVRQRRREVLRAVVGCLSLALLFYLLDARHPKVEHALEHVTCRRLTAMGLS